MILGLELNALIAIALFAAGIGDILAISILESAMGERPQWPLIRRVLLISGLMLVVLAAVFWFQLIKL